MHAIAFDTLEYTEQLKSAGVPDEQARGHAKALVIVMKQAEDLMNEWADKHDQQTEERLDGLATKQDLDIKFNILDSKIDKLDLKIDTKFNILDSKIDTKFNILDSKIDTKIKELEYRMTIRLGLMLAAAFGMLFTALRYFPPTQPIVISSHQMPAPAQNVNKAPVIPGVEQNIDTYPGK